MTALSVALAFAALCAWDAWRRHLASRVDPVSLQALMGKLEAQDAVLETQKRVIADGITEMRKLIGPVRSQIIAAQQQRQSERQ